jgi:DHA1 family tetracycline resistance protein-like MFS transporter
VNMIAIRRKKGALALIFFIMLMDVAGISIFYPIAPFIVRKYSPDPSMVTMLSVLYAAAQFIAAPVLGRLSDRYGRRPILLFSLIGSACGYVLFGIGGSLWMLFLSRVIDGLTGGNMSTAGAYIVDISLPEERAKNFTLVGLAWGAGLVIGPAMGSAFGQINLMAPAFIAAGLMLLSSLSGFFLLPESLPREKREQGRLSIKSLNPLHSMRDMLKRPAVRRLLIITCIFNLAFNGTNSIGSIYMIARFAAQPWQVGLYLVLLGIVLALMQLIAVPVLLPRFGEKNIAAFSFSAQAVGAIAVFFIRSLFIYFPVALVNGGVSGFVYPSMTALASNQTGENEAGSLMGVITALGSLMNIFGPLWAGLCFDLLTPASPFIIAAALFIVALSLLLHTGLKQPSRETKDQ